MTEIVFKCPFCGSPTRPTYITRKRVGAKCEKCDLIHFYAYSTSEMLWNYSHSEYTKESGKGGKK